MSKEEVVLDMKSSIPMEDVDKEFWMRSLRLACNHKAWTLASKGVSLWEVPDFSLIMSSRP